MSELGMFLTTVLGGAAFISVASLPLDAAVGEVLLRVGLWMNGVGRSERDQIIEWRRTGRLPQ